MSDGFDFIVVGAGSAGCVLANRLSADPANRVLLLEAGGGDRHPMIRMPLGWLAASNDPRFGWGYVNEPEESTGGRQWPQARGKLLGGTSSINGMMYSRGNAGDYDGWARRGLPGWGYADVLPYFRRSEASWRGDTDYHGAHGPLPVTRHPTTPPLYEKVVEAGRRLGFPALGDFAGPVTEGFGIPDFTIRDGQRQSSAVAFLQPALGRANLSVVTGALIGRLLIEEGRAVGIEYLHGDERRTARATREVILSAGVFNSPQILLLSGIGPAAELRALGIRPVIDLPGVGRNLREHPLVPMVFEANGPITFENGLRLDRLARALVAWRLFGRGPLARMPMTVQAYVRSRPGLAWPDIQFQLSHVSMLARPWFPGWRKGAGHMFTATVMQLRPEGSGDVTLRSADPRDPPRIRLGLLQAEADRQAARDCVRFARRLLGTEPAAGLIARELAPGPRMSSDAELDAYARQWIMTGAHPTSTCAMGIDDRAVVDAALRVRGIGGLRVVDASVMPTIISGNTNAPTIMIAEKASDMILGRPAPAPAAATQSAA